MPPLSIMLKPASSLCNLRCEYCFYHDVATLRENFSYGIMDSITSHNLIDKATFFSNGESICFAFQGGEPLLAGIDYFSDFVEYVKRVNHKKSKIYYSIQTNGTLLNKEWCEFFKSNNFLVGLSLDGNKNANKFRLDCDKNETFSKVENAISLLKENKVEFNILVVATSYTAKHINEIYDYFKRNNLRFLQFIPCLRPFGSAIEDERFMSVDDYKKFLINSFLLYAGDYRQKDYVSIRYFDNLVLLALGDIPEQCGVAGHCSHQFVIEGNGDVFPCDFYCLDEWKLGNINQKSLKEMAQSDRAKKFIYESLIVSEKCKKCRYYKFCRGGGCKRNRADRDYCEAYKGFFDKCLPVLNNTFSRFKRF